MERTSLFSTLRRLTGQSFIYGSADVASQAINLLLAPLYVKFLSPRDVGILGILTLFACVAKIVFRMGLESGFFRIYYDLDRAEDRRRLAGTVAVFLTVVGACLFLLTVLLAPLLAFALFKEHGAEMGRYVILVAGDIYVGTFIFIPLSLLRIQNRPGRFASMTGGRNVLNTALKVFLVVSGRGVAGVLWSDLIATSALAMALAPAFVRGARPALELGCLRSALGFGLPKAPHGIFVQILNLADRWILDLYHGKAVTGVYNQGYALGAGIKFVLSPFETAWQPFVYSHVGREDGPRVFARVATYIWAAFLAVGLFVAVLGPELLVTFTFTNPAFWIAAPVVPIVTLAYLLHGAFLLTSIGIGIEKKARYYPLITGSAAAVNLAANFLLIPTWGMFGAAWATVAAYAVMAAMGCFLSQRVYPIAFQKARLARLTAAALVTFFLSTLAPRPALTSIPTGTLLTVKHFLLDIAPGLLLPSVLAKLAILATFPALVVAFGVLSREEWAWLRTRLAVGGNKKTEGEGRNPVDRAGEP
jgi:O-antigen/teichoic acid export membrane protein